MRRWAGTALLIAAAVLAPAAHAAPRYQLVSATPPGWAWQPYVSATGRYVVWTANPGKADLADGWAQGVYLYDRVKHATEMVSVTPSGKPSDGGSSISRPEVTPDGRYVVFDSVAGDLVPGDTNGVSDVFVRDRVTRRTSRISVERGGKQAKEASAHPHVSADGKTVLFTSCARFATGSNSLACGRLYLWRRGVVTLVADGIEAAFDMETVSSDGRFAAFVKRGECRDDVYVYDVARGRVLPMTGDIAPPGAAGCTGDLARFDRPVLDATGRAVWFLRHDEGQEYARSYVLRRDVATGALTTVAELAGAQSTEGYDISADGRRVVYVGSTNGTVEGTAPSGSAVFTVEAGGKPVRLSPAPPMPVMQCHGSLAQTCTDSAQQPSMSADGSVIAFVTNVPISDADRTVTRDVYLAT